MQISIKYFDSGYQHNYKSNENEPEGFFWKQNRRRTRWYTKCNYFQSIISYKLLNGRSPNNTLVIYKAESVFSKQLKLVGSKMLDEMTEALRNPNGSKIIVAFYTKKIIIYNN